MRPISVALGTVGLLVTLPASRHARPAPAQLQLTVATIHAAALTTPRSAGDSLDQPYLLVSRVGPGSATGAARLPEGAHLTIRNDQALGAKTLMSLSLEPGDSVRLLLSLLEGPETQLAQEDQVAQAGTTVLTAPAEHRAHLLPSTLEPLTGPGAHWLGSVAVLLTNEDGVLRWRSFECLATCKVLAAPANPDLLAPPAPPIGGVAELSGGGGTYHLNLRSQRVP